MLQQNDVDALLAAFVATQEGTVDIDAQQRVSEVKIFDFAQPDNLPSEFMRALENINATFSRALAGMFSGYLSVGVHVEPLSTDQMTYRQFCNSVPDITAISTFSIAPLEGTALLELNSHLAWYMIERGLGGKGEILDQAREYTPLEKGLLDELVFRRIIRELGKAWKTLAPLRPTLREVVSNPAIARIAQPDDRMVACTFGIAIGDVTGMSSYCFPVSSLDFERMLTPGYNWDDDEEDEADIEAEHAQLLDNLQDARLTMRACLPDVTVSLGELTALTEGDVLYLDAGQEDPIEVRVGNLQRFYGHPLTVRDRVAVEITEPFLEVHHG